MRFRLWNLRQGFLLGLFMVSQTCCSSLSIPIVMITFGSLWLKRKGVRSDIFPLYKANRSETPEDLIPQFDLLRKLCVVLGLKIIENQVMRLMTLLLVPLDVLPQKFQRLSFFLQTKIWCNLSIIMFIWLIQLNKKNRWNCSYWKIWCSSQFGNRCSVSHGDTSDNIPGAPGIGPKQQLTSYKLMVL